MHSYFQDQMNKLEMSKKARDNDENGKVSINGLLIGEKDAIYPLPAPWRNDGDCYNMVLPNVLVNPAVLANWQDVVVETEEFRKIKSLWFFGNDDECCLNFISSFPELKELYIIESSCHEWDFLRDLKNLNYIFVRHAPYFDINALDPTKTGLRPKNIVLCYCGLESVEPFGHYRHIGELNLSHNSIRDISPLSGTDIYYCTLRWNNIHDIESLKNSVGYMLNVRHNYISEIQAIDKRVRRLYVKHNPEKDGIPNIPEHIADRFFIDKDFNKQENQEVEE